MGRPSTLAVIRVPWKGTDDKRSSGGAGLTRPKPPKGAGGQQAVDEAIEDFLQGHSPRLALPDAVAQMSQAVGEERRGACYAEDGEVRRAGRDRAPGEVGNEEADDQAIGKPHPEELGHGGWTAGKDGQHPYGSLLEFFYGSGRLHLFVGAKREMIETALQTSGAQGGKKLVLFGELTVVAAMVRQQHVHDGAGDEDDDGGEKNREPKSREGNHTQPPVGEDECRGCPRKRASPPRSRGQVWT